ncbi:MAG: AAA family ATPase [Sulfurimonas sp.]|nr:AAA family ATPase [Sulfurimonas sp.]
MLLYYQKIIYWNLFKVNKRDRQIKSKEEKGRLDASFLFFLRSIRFGKSLTIAMLCAYYDVYFKNEFDSIFKDTYVLEHPAPLKSSFYI